MFSPSNSKSLATALAAAALASAMAASGASADLHAIDTAAREAAGLQSEPPPPSSIATSAREEYQDLRSPDARDAAGLQSGQPSARERYSARQEYQDLRSPDAADAAPGAGTQDLRSPDTRDYANGYAPTFDSQPVIDEPSAPSGFDWVSALIGAAAATGIALVLMAFFGGGRLPGRRPASA